MMKLPKTMAYAVLMIGWESYPVKPGPDDDTGPDDEIWGDTEDYLDDCYNQISDLTFVDRVEDPMGAIRAMVVIVDIEALDATGRDLFWAEKEVLKVCHRNHLVLDL